MRKASVHQILTVSLRVKMVWAKMVQCIASHCGIGEAILEEERDPFDRTSSMFSLFGSV
jgi:hypothetical protein